MKVVQKCAKFYGVPVDDVMGRRRYQEIVFARHAAWSILRYRGVTCTELGRRFHRDHTSIQYGAKMGERLPLNQIMEVVL